MYKLDLKAKIKQMDLLATGGKEEIGSISQYCSGNHQNLQIAVIPITMGHVSLRLSWDFIVLVHQWGKMHPWLVRWIRVNQNNTKDYTGIQITLSSNQSRCQRQKMEKLKSKSQTKYYANESCSSNLGGRGRMGCNLNAFVNYNCHQTFKDTREKSPGES